MIPLGRHLSSDLHARDGAFARQPLVRVVSCLAAPLDGFLGDRYDSHCRTPKGPFISGILCDKIHKVGTLGVFSMEQAVLPIFLFVLCATATSLALLGVSALVGPHKTTRVKEMPYESGMDPIHDTRRRFDVRFYLVAIAFLVFDVELLFLYPWAVASRHPQGIDRAVASGWVSGRGLVFGEVMTFIALLAVGFAYAWRKGVFRWR
jgi:NADH-quinone oxidoreductase subunit A